MTDDTSGLQSLSREECVALLQSVDVGRIAFTDRALPAIVPVTFGVSGGCIVVRTSTTSRLARLTDGTPVAFEADELEPALHAGWSVLVLGEASVVQGAEVAHDWIEAVEPWAPGRREQVLRVPLTTVTGRRILPRPGGSTHVHVGPTTVGRRELW